MAESKARELANLARIAPAKGTLIAGDGSDWVGLAVGTDTQQLEADSAQTEGLDWVTPA